MRLPRQTWALDASDPPPADAHESPVVKSPTTSENPQQIIIIIIYDRVIFDETLTTRGVSGKDSAHWANVQRAYTHIYNTFV